MTSLLIVADTSAVTAGIAALSVKSQASGKSQRHGSDKENDNYDAKYDHDIDDDDEFFDAEDASLAGFTVTDDTEELDHDTVN